MIALNDSTCEELEEKCYYNNTFQLPTYNDNSTINSTFIYNNQTTKYKETNVQLNKALTRAHIWLSLLRNNYDIFSIASNVFLRDSPFMVCKKNCVFFYFYFWTTYSWVLPFYLTKLSKGWIEFLLPFYLPSFLSFSPFIKKIFSTLIEQWILMQWASFPQV